EARVLGIRLERDDLSVRPLGEQLEPEQADVRAEVDRPERAGGGEYGAAASAERGVASAEDLRDRARGWCGVAQADRPTRAAQAVAVLGATAHDDLAPEKQPAGPENRGSPELLG